MIDYTVFSALSSLASKQSQANRKDRTKSPPAIGLLDNTTRCYGIILCVRNGTECPCIYIYIYILFVRNMDAKPEQGNPIVNGKISDLRGNIAFMFASAAETGLRHGLCEQQRCKTYQMYNQQDEVSMISQSNPL